MADTIDLSDLEGLDDFDFGMFDDENQDINTEDRDPIANIKASALEHLLDTSNQAKYARKVAENALPEGFKASLDIADKVAAEVTTLYDSAKSELEGPVKQLGKTLADNTDSLLGFLSEEKRESIKNFLAPPKDEDTESTEKDKEDPNQALISAALSSLAVNQTKNNAVVNELNGMLAMEQMKAEGASSSIQAKLLAEVVKNTERQASFDEQVSIDSMKKSLELQFKQYFVAVETRDLINASSKDTFTALQVIAKNSALPDWQKSRLLENYQEVALGNLFQAVSNDVSNFTSGFTNKIRNRAKEKLQSIVSSVKDSVTEATSLADELGSQAGQLDADSRDQMAGDMLGEVVGNKISTVLGKWLQKFGVQFDPLQDASDQAMFAIENKDALLADFKRKYAGVPVLGDLLDIIDVYTNNGVVLPQKLEETATDAAIYDMITRKSIVEIIPGYLSRILAEVTGIRTGTEAERLVYSARKEAFAGIGQEAADVKDKIFDSVSKRRAFDADLLIERMDKDKKLSTGAKRELGKALIDKSQNNDTFDLEDISSSLSSSANGKELTEFLDQLNENTKKGELRKFATQYREIAKGNKASQEEVNRIVGVGNVDVLREAGLTKLEDGKTVFDNDSYLTEAGKYLGDKRAKDYVKWQAEREAREAKKNESATAKWAADKVKAGKNKLANLIGGEETPPDGTPPTITDPNPNEDTLGQKAKNAFDAASDAVKTGVGMGMVGASKVKDKVTQVVTDIDLPSAPIPKMMLNEDGSRKTLEDIKTSLKGNTAADRIAEFKKQLAEMRAEAEGKLASLNPQEDTPEIDDQVSSLTRWKDKAAKSWEDMSSTVTDKFTKTVGTFQTSVDDFSSNVRNSINNLNTTLADKLTELSETLRTLNRTEEAEQVDNVNNPTISSPTIERNVTALNNDINNGATTDADVSQRVNSLTNDVKENQDVSIRTRDDVRIPRPINNNRQSILPPDISNVEVGQTDNNSLSGNGQELQAIREGIELIVENSKRLIPDLRSTLFVNDGSGWKLPIQMDASASEDTNNSGDFEREIVSLVGVGFAKNHALLEQVVFNTDTANKKGFMARQMDKIGGLLTGASKLTKSYFKGVGSASTKIFGAAGAAVSKVIGVTLGGLSGIASLGPKDLYLKGETEEPVLLASKMRKGHYIDKETGKVIKRLKDITGDVVDLEGNIVVTAKDISEKGLYTPQGNSIASLLNIVYKPLDIINASFRLTNKLIKGTFKLGKRTLGIGKARVHDVYVGGNSTPTLLKIIFNNGGYFSASTGKMIPSPGYIDGEVKDKNGDIILSNDDIKKGLYDQYGLKVGTSRLWALTKKIVTGSIKAVGWASKKLLGGAKLTTKATGNIALGLGKAVGGLLGYGKTKIINNFEGADILNNIYSHMSQRWPLDGVGEYETREDKKVSLLEQIVNNTAPSLNPEPPSIPPAVKPKFFDSDGDGDRDGSWQDQPKDDKGDLSKDVPPEVKDKDEKKGILGTLLSMAGVIMSGFSALTSGLGLIKGAIFKLGKYLKPILTGGFRLLSKGVGALVSAFVASKAAGDEGSTLEDLMGGDDEDKDNDKDDEKKKKTKRKGNREGRAARGRGRAGGRTARGRGRASGAIRSLTGRATGVIGNVASNLTSSVGGELVEKATGAIGGELVEKAASVLGAGALKKGAVAVGGAIATVLGAPIVATGLAIAGAGYTVYEIGSFFGNRLDAEEFERLRFMQYGINCGSGSEMSVVRDLESDVIDEITMGAGIPSFKMSIGEAVSNFGGNFGVSEDSAPEVISAWASWFQYRFLPILLAHLTIAAKIDKSLDVTDIDDELDEDDKPKYLNYVTDKKNFSGMGDPYAVNAGPFPQTTVAYGIGEIGDYVRMLTKKYPFMSQSEKEDPSAYMPATVVEDKETDEGVGGDWEPVYADTQAPPKYQYRPTQSRGGSIQAGRFNLVDVTKEQTSQGLAEQATEMGVYIPDADAKLGSGDYMVPTKGRFSSPYGDRTHPISGARKKHNGIDIAAPAGTPIMAAQDGTIQRKYRSNSYGNVIYMTHPDGNQTRYAHMSKFADVQEGQTIKRGQVIGFVGNTGASAGNHLHFEVRSGHKQDSPSIDPKKVLAPVAKKDLTKTEAEAKKTTSEPTVSVTDTLEGYDTMKNKKDPAQMANITASPDIPLVNKPKPTAPTSTGAGSVLAATPSNATAAPVTAPAPEAAQTPIVVNKPAPKGSGDSTGQLLTKLAEMNKNSAAYRTQDLQISKGILDSSVRSEGLLKEIAELIKAAKSIPQVPPAKAPASKAPPAKVTPTVSMKD